MDSKTSLEAVILPVAHSLRRGTGSVTLSPIPPSQTGHSHSIYIVTLSDTSKLIARVAKSQDFDDLERNGVNMLNHIAASNPSLRVPKVVWHNLEQNPREFTVVLQEPVPGKPLGVWNSTIPQSRQKCFLDSLARFLVELWSIPTLVIVEEEEEEEEGGGGGGDKQIYSQWLEDKIDKGIKRCVTGDNRWAYPHDHITEYGIAHGDLHAGNVLVDEKLELTGVVDWDWTFTAPLPAIIQFPWFIANVPGWHNSNTNPGETFAQDREYLVQALRAAEMSTHKTDKLTNLLASARKRQIFQSAISYIDIHKEFVEENERFQGARGKDVRVELEAFLVENPDLKDMEEIKRIMASM